MGTLGGGCSLFSSIPALEEGDGKKTRTHR